MNRSQQKLHHSDDRWLSHVYDRYVQLLYKYGMNVCPNSHIVLRAVQQLLIGISDQPKLFVAGPALRFCLFKRFRDLIFKYVFDDPFAQEIAHNQVVDTNQQMSQQQREASFLKLYCAFSYQEVASIMSIDLESVYELVMQAIEISRKQKQDQIAKVYEVH